MARPRVVAATPHAEQMGYGRNMFLSYLKDSLYYSGIDNGSMSGWLIRGLT